ncbi:hypothetical protein EG329_004123 [Mollisiaceae sp. DMI_Dod_QoI]|nr:hypothetical protein EG329_004123 [Helotiales sp. DMI_Dod_QoI]
MAFEQGSMADLAISLSQTATGADQSPTQGHPLAISNSPSKSLKCAICNKVGATLCMVCGSISYCSQSCKEKDAGYHQSVCPAFKAFLDTGRPREDARLALFFAEMPMKPQLFWVIKQGLRLMKVEKRAGQLSYTDILGPHDQSGSLIPIDTNFEQKFSLDHTITVYHRSNFFWDNRSATNLAIFDFTKGEHKYDWRGPIAVFSKHDIAHTFGFRDITLADLRVFRDFLVNYGEGLEKTLQYGGLRIVEAWDPALWERLMLRFMPKNAKVVKGVKISSVGDMETFGLQQFSPVDIPSIHPIFINEDEDAPPVPTQVSVEMDLPLLVRQCVSAGWKDLYIGQEEVVIQLRRADVVNEPATLLTTIADVNSSLWGGNEEEMKHKPGTVLVVREDKEDLTVEQVKAMADYIKHHLKPAIEEEEKRAMELDEEQIREGREHIVVNHMTMECVRKHFKVWKESTGKK